MLNFVDIKEGDSAMDNYRKLIDKIRECSEDMKDDEVAWFDMGDFQVGMNKELMDELRNMDHLECRAGKDTSKKFKDYLKDVQGELKKDPEVKKDDNVNHPKHYTSGKYECLAVMVDTFGVEAVKNFCKCNAFKYTWRSDKKNGTEDIAKATFYLNFLKGLEEGKSAEEILKNIHG